MGDADERPLKDRVRARLIDGPTLDQIRGATNEAAAAIVQVLAPELTGCGREELGEELGRRLAGHVAPILEVLMRGWPTARVDLTCAEVVATPPASAADRIFFVLPASTDEGGRYEGQVFG